MVCYEQVSDETTNDVQSEAYIELFHRFHVFPRITWSVGVWIVKLFRLGKVAVGSLVLCAPAATSKQNLLCSWILG
jgi:hypothetical protein